MTPCNTDAAGLDVNSVISTANGSTFHWLLKERASWAFLKWRGEVYAAESVGTLVEAIYDRNPAFAREMLRARIYASAEPGMTERELVRVAAKRLSIWEKGSESETEETTKFHFLERPALTPEPVLPQGYRLGQRLSQTQVKELIQNLLIQKVGELSGEKKYERDRVVAAVLLDRDGILLAAEHNTNARIRTRHAEMNLILRRRQSNATAKLAVIPCGSRLFVSLKPCAMCAAAIWNAAEDLADFQVMYFEDDPGRLARNTMLVTNSPVRRRFLAGGDPLLGSEIQIEWQDTEI